MLSLQRSCLLAQERGGSKSWAQLSPRLNHSRVLRLPVLLASKKHVSYSFGGRSPERKAAEALLNLFTFCAAQAVLYQLGGGGEGGDVPPTLAYQELESFLQDHPVTDGDAWLTKLLAQNQLLGVRVMEVREAYCAKDFDWEGVKELTTRQIREGNIGLMRQFATERFGGTLGLGPPQANRERPPDEGDMSCYI